MSQANQNFFWSYYYSALAVMILLLLIKSTPRHLEDNFDSFQVNTVVLSPHIVRHFAYACVHTTHACMHAHTYAHTILVAIFKVNLT